jgi:Xaa-Pro aminopeptidase
MNSRLSKLRQKISKSEIDLLLISQPENRRYLSGFTGSSGYLFISIDKAILATDFRYVEQAKQETENFEIVLVKGKLTSWLLELLSEIKPSRLGFEADAISFSAYQQLEEVRNNLGNIELVPTKGLVESLRIVKEPKEIALLSQAARMADATMEYLQEVLKPGMTEKESAWLAERFLRENGSESLYFEVIVASGANAALPHARPSEQRLSTQAPIIIDLGARVKGYCSDLSRTICLGDPDETFKRIYSIVLEAQLRAIEGLRPGLSGLEADGLARQIIETEGYGDAFGHGLGHGVGLAGHEPPTLGSESDDILAENMVFTVEPGIYLPVWGGVRIEDMVVMEGSRARVLTWARKTVS